MGGSFDYAVVRSVAPAVILSAAKDRLYAYIGGFVGPPMITGYT
jgi:hypothetical protein